MRRLRNTIRCFGTVFLFSFLAGCYCKYHPIAEREAPNVALSENFESSLEHPAFVEGESPEKEWWNFFEDEQLDYLIETTLLHHPNIKIAEANALLANYSAHMVRSALYPSANAHGEIYRFRQSKTGIFGAGLGAFPLNYTQTTTILDFEYELDFWNKNRNNFISKVDLIESSLADLGQAQLGLELGVAQSYFDYQTSAFRKSIIEELLKNRQEFLSLIQLTVEHHLKSHYSTLDVEREIYLLRDLSDQLTQQMEIDIHALQQYLAGDFLDSIEPRLSDFESLRPFPLPCNLPLNLLAHRPEIISQLWKVRSILHEVYAAEALFYPNINLSAVIGFQTIHIQKLLRGESTYSYFGPAVDLPVFDAAKRDANYGIQQQKYESAVFEYDRLLLLAVEEVLDALTQVKESYNRFQEYLKLNDVSKQLNELSEIRFANNVASRMDLLNSQKDVLNSQDDAARIYGIYLQSQVRLFKALGGGFICEQCSE